MCLNRAKRRTPRPLEAPTAPAHGAREEDRECTRVRGAGAGSAAGGKRAGGGADGGAARTTEFGWLSRCRSSSAVPRAAGAGCGVLRPRRVRACRACQGRARGFGTHRVNEKKNWTVQRKKVAPSEREQPFRALPLRASPPHVLGAWARPRPAREWGVETGGGDTGWARGRGGPASERARVDGSKAVNRGAVLAEHGLARRAPLVLVRNPARLASLVCSRAQQEKRAVVFARLEAKTAERAAVRQVRRAASEGVSDQVEEFWARMHAEEEGATECVGFWAGRGE